MNGSCQIPWELMGGIGGRVEATCGLANCLSGGAMVVAHPHSGDHHHGLSTHHLAPRHPRRCCHLGNDCC